MKNIYEVHGDIVHVSVNMRGGAKQFYISVSDLEKISSIKGSWSIHYGAGGKLYIKTRVTGEKYKKIQILLHRFLTDCGDGMDVDHVDGNPLNNVATNLRVSTHKENCRNRVKANKNNESTGIRGVSLTATGKYRARSRRNGKFVHIGLFLTEKEAINARDKFEQAG